MRATRATVNVMRSTCYQNQKLGLQMVGPLNAGIYPNICVTMYFVNLKSWPQYFQIYFANI